MIGVAGVPPTLGGTSSLLAGLVLPALVGVTPLLLAWLLLMALLLAGLFVGLFQAMLVHAGLLTRFVLAAMFVAGGAFFLPVAGV